MLQVLIFAFLSSPSDTSLRLSYGPVITPIVEPYAKCVADRTPSPYIEAVKAAFDACAPIRQNAIDRAQDRKLRSDVRAAISDFEMRYLQFTLNSTDAR